MYRQAIQSLRMRNRFTTVQRVRPRGPSPWYRRLLALAELAGDHTQQDIARTLGVSESAVTGWKEGRPPKPDKVKAAAKAYGVDALELMRIAYLSEDGEADPPAKRRPRKAQPDPNGSAL